MDEETSLLIDKMHSYLDVINELNRAGKLNRIHLSDLDSCEFSLRELIEDAKKQEAGDSFLGEDELFDSYDDVLDVDY